MVNREIEGRVFTFFFFFLSARSGDDIYDITR